MKNIHNIALKAANELCFYPSHSLRPAAIRHIKKTSKEKKWIYNLADMTRWIEFKWCTCINVIVMRKGGFVCPNQFETLPKQSRTEANQSAELRGILEQAVWSRWQINVTTSSRSLTHSNSNKDRGQPRAASAPSWTAHARSEKHFGSVNRRIPSRKQT